MKCKYLYFLILFFIISGCTQEQKDYEFYNGQSIVLMKWQYSLITNTVTGSIDTLRPTSANDSIKIILTGYMNMYKGEELLFNCRVNNIRQVEEIDSKNYPCQTNGGLVHELDCGMTLYVQSLQQNNLNYLRILSSENQVIDCNVKDVYTLDFTEY